MTIERTLLALRSLLDQRGADWAILGGHAANLYRGEVRGTTDVDVLVSMTAQDLSALVPDLKANGWVVRYRVESDWLLRARHADLGDVDMMAVQGDYQRLALSRAVARRIEGVGDVRFFTAEDVLIHKTIAYRSQDEADVVSILNTSPELDLGYMREWLKKWDIQDRYDRLRERAEAERQPTCGSG